MNFEFSDEQEELRASVRRFLEERAPLTYVREMYDDPRGTTDAVWSGLAELGVIGLLVPEVHGGAGRGMVDVAVVAEELGRAVHPGPCASSAIGAASLVTLAGSDADREELLPGLASGETVGTTALLEPGRRAEWRDPTTTAVANGDGWRLHGEKVHVADGAAAGLLIVTATDGDGALAAFVVESGAAGVSVDAAPTVDGSRKEATVGLAGAPARRLGAGDATGAIATTVDRLAVASVVDGVGAAGRALELSVAYATERQQFGAPVGSFQAVQHLCADMLRAVELARAAGYYACWAADAADPAEGHRAATMALAFAGDDLYEVGASAIQVHGGIGFTWEHDIHLFYKRLLTLQHTGGGTLDQLEALATIILD
jgi:alkylation response protein AidB-like acyl-CoA dehydrogenase